jgi:hypothetical protein
MPNPILTARVSPAIVARVERCAEELKREDDGALQTDRGTVVRRLILLALPLLERDLHIALPVKAAAKKRSPNRARR